MKAGVGTQQQWGGYSYPQPTFQSAGPAGMRVRNLKGRPTRALSVTLKGRSRLSRARDSLDGTLDLYPQSVPFNGRGR